MATGNNANIGFEKQIWDAACVLWGHIPAAEYRKVIVGLIFLRYISSAFEKRYQELVAEGDGFEDDRDAYVEDNIFFVPEDARWSKIASAAHTPEIGTVIDDAMRAIEKENTTLKNVLPKNYASPDLDKRVLGDVVDLFTNMDMGDTEESKDLLGRTYEYCIQQFAAYEGVKGGEFYTPASIVKTIVAILKPFKNCRVYDPCCGSGGMFVQSAKFIQAHSGKRGEIAVYGQESNADTWKMAKMNMAIRGIDADFGPYQADTFFNDLHKTLKADFIMANPPFNLSNWGQEKLKDDVRWKYGTPPAGNANYAWIQHMIHHLAPNGKIGLVLANGALSSQSSGEGEIRKNIIQADLVEGIVALPTQLFYSVTIPVTLAKYEVTEKQNQENNSEQNYVELFLSAKRIEGCSEKSLKYYKATIEAMLDELHKGVKHIVTDDIRGYLTEYQEKKKSSKVTIDNIRRILSSFFSWLEDEDYILKSPVRRIHRVKTGTNIKETYSDEALELMRDNCTELRDLAIIDMLASTGMRVGEMVLLNRNDIDFNERECIVFGKGSKERVVYFDARTKIHLQNYLESRTDDNPALFVSLKSPHERLKIGGVEVRLREFGKQLGLQKVHPHKFRRTLATMAIDKGMELFFSHSRFLHSLNFALITETSASTSE